MGIPLFYTECHRSSAPGQPHAEKQSASCEKRLSYKITAGIDGRDERHTLQQSETQHSNRKHSTATGTKGHGRQSMLKGRDQLLETTRIFLKSAMDSGIIDTQEHSYLSKCLSSIPETENCGLQADQAEQFIHTTIQLIQACLYEKEPPRTGFVTPILQKELDRHCQEKGGSSWNLESVNDVSRKGKDRRFTFGQVKQNPDDPDDPSFFGGVWLANCDGKTRRIAFAIVADVIPGSEAWEPVENLNENRESLHETVKNRGQYPWKLQVNPDSDLGRWIVRLTGTPNVGQHSGHIPLGVLGEAVRRALEPRGLTHLLLGPSRRDPPTEPWHTGSFLRRIGSSFDFEWRGYAIEPRRDTLVEATCVIGVRGKILQILDC